MKRLLLLLVALVITSTACSAGGGDTYAAKVNGKVITTTTVMNELKTITSNPQYAAVLNEQLGGTGVGTGLQPGGANTVNARYTAQIVFNRILVSLIDDAAAKEKVTATADQTASAERSVRQDIGDDSLFNGLPQDYRSYLIDRQAKLSALVATRSTPAATFDYYNKNSSQFVTYCVSHILVNTKSEADSIRTQIVNGASFAALAKQFSTDNQSEDSSAAKGGDLGCYSTSELDQFITPFRDAVLALTPNTLSQPVQTQFGYHIINVTSKKQLTFEEAKAQITSQLSQPGTYLTELLKDAKVKVNPRFGVYQPATEATATQSAQSAGVSPPPANGVGKKPETSGDGAPQDLLPSS